MMFRKIGKIGAFLYIAAIVVVTVVLTIRDADRNLIREVVIETGTSINIEDFFKECPDDARFITDVSGIDTNIPAVYKLKVFYSDAFEKDVYLKIEDRTPPKGVAVPQKQFTKAKWPEASECVTFLYDLSGIAKIEYKDGAPKFEETGDYLVSVIITDWYNNQTVIDVPFEVINDCTAPLIRGVHALECNGNPDEVDFYNGIRVVDDYDEFPIMKVDDSLVNYAENGEYEVIYRAIDHVGNMRTVKTKMTVTLPEEASDSESSGGDYGGYSYGDPYPLAANILAGLWGGSDVATARNIFNWVHGHIYYQNVYGAQTYTSAAYRGFSRRSGDCYVYYACAKMLLDLAGIPNRMVTRYPVTGNGHYWNLVYLEGEWYHCDATVFRAHPSVYFMCTDEEISDSYHHFDGSRYPARAGGSTEFLPSPTPTPVETPTPTIDPNASPTPTPDPNASPTPTDIPTASPTPTRKPNPWDRLTVTPTQTPTPTPPPEDTPTNTPTPPPEDTPTDMPTPTPTPVPETTEPDDGGTV